jgi:quinol monooxygenase YgiN
LKLQPGKGGELSGKLRKPLVTPLLRRRGCGRVYLLSSGEGAPILWLGLWDSKNDADSFRQSPGFNKILEGLSPLPSHSPSIEGFEVWASGV